MKFSKRIVRILLVVTVVVVATFSVNYHFQKPLTYNHGFGWDGLNYGKMAYQFSTRNNAGTVAKPYGRRILTPYLAGKYVGDFSGKFSTIDGGRFLNAFETVNFLAAILGIVLLSILLAARVRSWVVVTLLVSLFALHWLAPLRYIAYYRMYVDPILILSVIVSCLAMEWIVRSNGNFMSVLSMSVVTGLAVLNHEATFMLGIAALFCKNPILVDKRALDIKNLIPARLFLPLITGIAAFVWSSNYNPNYSSGNFYIGQIANIIMIKGIGVLVLSIFYVFGPLIVILIAFRGDVYRFLLKNQHYFALIAANFVFFMIGGEDNERFLMWSLPVVYLIMAVVIDKNSKFFRTIPILALVIFSAQLITHRVFWTTPISDDATQILPILFTPWSSDIPQVALYSSHGIKLLGAFGYFLALFQYLIFSAIVLILISIKYRNWKHKKFEQ